MRHQPVATTPVHFDVWGCRGSRNLVPRRSVIGNNTSCYSLLSGEDLFVLDAGRGLAAVGHALGTEARFRHVRRLHILVTHAHLDHWEGLKDADWFWLRRNGLKVRILAPEEALTAIQSAYQPPSYVPLELLAAGTIDRLEYVRLRAGDRRVVGPWTIRTGPLNHYSGEGADRYDLETIGYRLTAVGGATVAYLSDHEPNLQTARSEARLLDGAHLALYDSHFPDLKQQTFGHGSQEHAANVARRSPETLILAGHHGPALSDSEIKGASRRHGRGLANYCLAVEGRTFVWDSQNLGFVPHPRSKL